MMPNRRVCTRCQKRYAQDGQLCTRCQREMGLTLPRWAEADRTLAFQGRLNGFSLGAYCKVALRTPPRVHHDRFGVTLEVVWNGT